MRHPQCVPSEQRPVAPLLLVAALLSTLLASETGFGPCETDEARKLQYDTREQAQVIRRSNQYTWPGWREVG